MKIENEVKLTFDDVMIKPKRSALKSRNDVSLSRKFKFRHSQFNWEGVPIIAANMDTVGTLEMANNLSEHKMLTALHKFYTHKDLANINLDYTILTIGEGKYPDYLSDKAFYDKYNFLLVDVANGYRECFLEFIKELRAKFPNKIIIAGNVATREMTEALILAGADIVKIGIGPGAVCTTRKVTGVGYPQLSAISECADAAHGLTTGDIVTVQSASHDNTIAYVNVVDDGNFEIKLTYAADEAITWQMGSYLLVATSGIYRGVWKTAFSQALNQRETGVMSPVVNTMVNGKATGVRLLSNNTDSGSMTGNGIMSFSAGDRIWFAVQCTAAQTLTFLVTNTSIH